MQNLLELSQTELQSSLEQMQEPAYRSWQIWQWIWQKSRLDFQGMTNISKDLRNKLERHFTIALPWLYKHQISRDGTVKFLLQLQDNCLVESILIPEKDHYTQCLSTQVGCPLACKFCSTGQMGYKRNLTSGEILGQILIALDYLHRNKDGLPLRNLVFMGMGEPLLNWTQLRRSLEVIRDPYALNFSYRRVTVSTVGLIDKMQELADTGLASLAISLHAPDQKLRASIMPLAAQKSPMQELLPAIRDLPMRSRQRVTIEYLLLGGVNDNLRCANELNRILSDIKCKINLIAFNPGPGINFQSPSPEKVYAFEKFLWEKGRNVTLRKSKGKDIMAACGQLCLTDIPD